jgi:L-amino acid N-acyltransferase YncA
MNHFVRGGGRDIKVEGGLVRTGRIDGEKYCFLEDPASVVRELRKCGTRVDLFTFIQKLPDTIETKPAATPKYTYPMEWDNFAALPITTFEDWWTKTLGFKARNKAKQAEKHGVVLKEMEYGEAVIRGIWEIYNETPIRQGKRFQHYGMTLEQVRQYAGTFLDQSIFIGAFLEDRMIGFIKMTWNETRTQAGLMHILSLVSERDKAPTNALVARAVRACADRGIPWLVYSNFAYGKKQTDSLSDFKERNGFQKVDVPRYYVPLNPLGWAVFRMGLHHKLIDHLPEAWITRLREFRSSWYAKKLQTADKAL